MKYLMLFATIAGAIWFASAYSPSEVLAAGQGALNGAGDYISNLHLGNGDSSLWLFQLVFGGAYLAYLTSKTEVKKRGESE